MLRYLYSKEHYTYITALNKTSKHLPFTKASFLPTEKKHENEVGAKIEHLFYKQRIFLGQSQCWYILRFQIMLLIRSYLINSCKHVTELKHYWINN